MDNRCDYVQCPGYDEGVVVLQTQEMNPPIELRFHWACVPLALDVCRRPTDEQARHN